MRSTGRLAALWLLLGLLSGLLAPIAAAQETPPVDSSSPERVPWEISGSVFYSDPPGSEDRLTPIVYADRGALHLELRHNYEDLQTTSFFAGWNLGWGFGANEELALGLTPMLGVAVGETDGIAPGLELDLGWRRLAWYAEMEYLFDLHDRDDDFYYSWSTLTYGLTDWLSAGLVTERSKLVDTDFSVQRGLLVAVSRAHVGLSLQAYNLGSDDSYAVVALELAP